MLASSSEQTGSDSTPLVSIIILNWNGAACLPRCILAVQSQTYPNYEAIIIDNASSDHSADDLESAWGTEQGKNPRWRLVRLEQNLGFAAANNLGARLAQGRWLALLNNDAFPEPDWLASLIQAARTRPEYAFFSSRLVQARRPELLDGAGDVYHTSGLAWPRMRGQPLESAPQQPDEVFSPCAAAALYDREAFLRVGGFDETYVSHHEDVDLGFRLRLDDLRCLYVPDAIVAHLGSASYGIESDHTVYQVQRNLIWTYLKNMPGGLLWKYLPAHLAANLFHLVYYSLRGQAGAVWRAKWDAVQDLPAVLRKRRTVQSQRKVSAAQMARAFEHGLLSPYLLGRRGAALKKRLHLR
ncbi:MAG: glycosyltransferase family 2 protein [Anaerolineales bacterium]|nr:glycosyltransferase family 2 protein [Anaerolineales bacterium]